MLSIISIEENEKWDRIVKSFKNYDVYYLSGYPKAFQLHGDGEPTLFYYENGNTRAINVVMIRDIANDENFNSNLPKGLFYDMVTPYGYGGILLEGDITNDRLMSMDEEYSSYCMSKGIVSEFVRFHPILKNSEVLKDIYDISELGKTISMNLNSKEQIWNDFTSKNRNMVRKAQNAGVKILWGSDANLLKEFIQLYNTTMEKDKAKAYYYFQEDYYNSIFNDLQNNTLMLYATFGDKIIAMTIILFANQHMHYHLSASVMDYRHLAPTNLLLYEAACWGSENGFKKFHLGGGLGSKEDSLFKFKSAFNRKSDNTFKIGRKIFYKKKYEELVEIRKAQVLRTHNSDAITKFSIDATTDYFPMYRAEFITIGINDSLNDEVLSNLPRYKDSIQSIE